MTYNPARCIPCQAHRKNFHNSLSRGQGQGHGQHDCCSSHCISLYTATCLAQSNVQEETKGNSSLVAIAKIPRQKVQISRGTVVPLYLRYGSSSKINAMKRCKTLTDENP